MSENDEKKGISAEPHEEVSGTDGLQRTSTGNVERTEVVPAIYT